MNQAQIYAAANALCVLRGVSPTAYVSEVVRTRWVDYLAAEVRRYLEVQKVVDFTNAAIARGAITPETPTC